MVKPAMMEAMHDFFSSRVPWRYFEKSMMGMRKLDGLLVVVAA